jgi:hypothetical protein
MRRRFLTSSAQQIDPLSWFTGPLLPLTFSIVAGLYGLFMTLATWHDSDRPWWQLVAVPCFVVACLTLHVLTGPLRSRLTAPAALAALSTAALGVVLSAYGYRGSDFALELWWAQGALSLCITALGPALPPLGILVVGGVTTFVTSTFSLVLLGGIENAWGPVGTVAIVAMAPLMASIMTAVFAYRIVSEMVPLLQGPAPALVVDPTLRDEAAERMEHVALARLTARAVPFLEAVVARGTVTASERALAGQLARRIRDDLVTQSSLTWLDEVAPGSRLVVLDPERRAPRMNHAQRTALRALLRELVATEGIDDGSLMIELRAGEQGATAVGVSLDIRMPEGPRIVHLAPYYLTLQTAVRDLQVDRNGPLRFSFTVD